MKKIIIFLLVFSFGMKEVYGDYHGVLKGDKVHRAVTVYDNQVKEMKKRGYSKERILDLTAIQTMECNLYNGNCLSSSDVGFFQINQIHTKQYKKSVRLLKVKKYGELYQYQLTFANGLLDSYLKGYCSDKNFKKIGKIRTEKERIGCIGRMYNGHPKHKKIYGKLLYQKREIIKKYLHY